MINGKQIQKDEKIKVPQAFYRVSAFSSSHQLWSQNLNFSELLTRKIKTARLTEGSCTKPQIKLRWKTENTEILPFSDCPKSIVLNFEKKETIKKQEKNNHAFVKKLSVKNNNLNKLENFDDSYELDSSLLSSEELSNSLEDLASEEQTWFSNIPPWLIIGAGAATFILIISLSNQGGKRVQQKESMFINHHKRILSLLKNILSGKGRKMILYLIQKVFVLKILTGIPLNKGVRILFFGALDLENINIQLDISF